MTGGKATTGLNVEPEFEVLIKTVLLKALPECLNLVKIFPDADNRCGDKLP